MKRSTAIYIAIGIFIFFIIFVYITLSDISSTPKIKNNTFIEIKLSGTFKDYSLKESFIKKRISPTLWNIYRCLNKAKNDERIKGLLIKISPTFYAKFSQIEEFSSMIKDFRKTGKKVYFHISYAGKGVYSLASSGDKIFLDPVGEIFLNGFSFEVMFYKNFFKKIGIKADFLHIGEYKTASNIYTEEKFTNAHKEMLENLLTVIYNDYKKELLEKRNFKPADLDKIFKKAVFTADSALSYKLIDDIKDYEELKETLKKEKYRFIRFNNYLRKETTYISSPNIAIIFAQGTISIGRSGNDPLWGTVLGADSIKSEISSILKKSSIKAVIVRVNSPGGSVLASDLIQRSLSKIKKRKIPLIISMGSVAASGGYWISAKADRILANKFTYTGSIGVLGGKFVTKGLFGKLGFTIDTVEKGEYPRMFSSFKEFSPEEKKIAYNELLYIYKKFVKLVSEGRKIPENEVDRIGRGRVWMGSTAKKLRLVDEIGGINKAISIAKKMAKIKTVRIVVYPKKKTFFEKLEELGFLSKVISLIKNPQKKFKPVMFFLLPYSILTLK